ncbi:MAG: hypothetical protein ACPGYV_13130, partial [Phycisphaeraceae bacterium]
GACLHLFGSDAPVRAAIAAARAAQTVLPGDLHETAEDAIRATLNTGGSLSYAINRLNSIGVNAGVGRGLCGVPSGGDGFRLCGLWMDRRRARRGRGRGGWCRRSRGGSGFGFSANAAG